MTLRAVRVPDLDGLNTLGYDDRLFLIAGIWVECSGCRSRIDLEPIVTDWEETVINKPYLESIGGSSQVWCQVCARDIEGAFESTRDELLHAVRTDYGEAVTSA
jgi:hypothetical protein